MVNEAEKIMAYSCSLFFLAVLAKEDIKEKQISVYKLLFFGVPAFLGFLWKKGFLWEELFRSLLPGILMLFLAYMSKESMGYGDGLTVMILGLWTGLRFTLAVLCVAILAAGIWGSICLLRKRTETIPFIPFLLLGMEVVLVGT